MKVETKAISTQYGLLLNGRCCIHLDDYSWNQDVGVVTLEGDLNGDLVEHTIKDKWIPFKLTLSGVINSEHIQEDSDFSDIETKSNFDVGLSKSNGIIKLIIKTYDDVFVVECNSYKWEYEAPYT